MRPLKQIIDEVKIDLKQFTNDDRINYLDKYLQDKSDDIRATLIRSEIATTGRVDEKYYMSVCCIEVECLQQGCVINGVLIPSGTVIWKADLPDLIEGIGEADLKYLGLDDYQHDFKRVGLSSFANSSGDIFNDSSIMYHIFGNTAYFKNLPTSGIKFLCALGLWSKPTSVCNYNYMTDIYPVPSVNKLKMLLRMEVLRSWGYVTEKKAPTGEDKTIDLTATEERSLGTANSTTE
jgi:hypothetical protein